MKRNIFSILSISAYCLIAITSMGQKTRSSYDNNDNYNRNATEQKVEIKNQRVDTLPIQFVGKKDSLPQGRMSLRNDFPYQQAPYKKSDALAYPSTNKEDIAFNVRIWEDIDTRKADNRALMYAMDDYGTHKLMTILLNAIKQNQLTAFSAEDDRFTIPLTPEQVTDAMGTGLDTSATYDLDGNIVGYQVRSKVLDLDSIYTFRVKEDWFYDKNYGKMMVRIIGIAPVTTYTLSTGEIIPNSEHPLFWIYFPDVRSILTQYSAYSTQNPGTKIPFQELFDLRQFKGKMVKSNYQNPGEINWDILYPNLEDQKKEANKIKKIIHNYSSSLYNVTSEDAPLTRSERRKNK